MISPAEFIPVAEDTGLDQPARRMGDDHRLRRGCQLARRRPGGGQRLAGSVPLRARLALKVTSAPRRLRTCRRGRLELEITEAVLIRDDETALEILHGLREIGVRIALGRFWHRLFQR